MGGPARRVVSEALVPRVVEMARHRDFSPHDLSIALWATVTLEVGASSDDSLCKASNLARELILAARGQSQEFRHQSVSLFVWSAGLDRSHHAREVALEFVPCVIEQAGDMNPQMLSNCAWGFARLLLTASESPELYNHLAVSATKLLASLTHQNVSNLLWAFAKVEARSGAVHDHFLAVCRSRCELMVYGQAHYVATAAWAISKVCFPEVFWMTPEIARQAPPEISSAVVQAATTAAQNTSSWKTRELAMVVWSVAKSQQDCRKLLPAAVTRLAEVNAPAHDVAMILGAFSTLETSVDDVDERALNALLRSALRDLQHRHVEESMLVHIAWSCAKSGLRGPATEVVGAISRIAIASPGNSWNSLGLLIVAWSVVMPGRYTRETAKFVRTVFLQHAEAAVKEANTDLSTGITIARVLSSIDAAMHADPELRGGPSVEGITTRIGALLPAEVTASTFHLNVVHTLEKLGEDVRQEILVHNMPVDIILPRSSSERLVSVPRHTICDLFTSFVRP